jgi:uncharacterized protein (TIGR00661 family)
LFAAKNNIQTVLVAPLDWGLGHATRCIPIINALIANNFRVILAAERGQQALLQKEFPQLLILPLTGYRMGYSKHKKWLPIKLALQIPKIIAAIKREQKWLNNIIHKYSIDLVISDNRYGLYHHTIPSVIITHQLQIQTPKWLQAAVTKLNYRWINRFTQCWIPDFAEGPGIAGKLSHPPKLPSIPVHYVGALSRFKQMETSTHFEYDFLILLSGPEPQRSLLENLLLQKAKYSSYRFLLVRGKPGSTDTIAVSNNITVYNHLPTDALENTYKKSKWVICRSGYSTIMELLSIQKKAVLIPTPGQTEQEYLAIILAKQGLAFSIEQTEITSRDFLNEVANFSFNTVPFTTISLELKVKELIQAIS